MLNSKYPFFDLSEIIPDNELKYRAYQPLKPVKAGNLIPDINLSTDYSRWQNFYNGAPTQGLISLRNLYGKPLAIAFYSKHWQDRGVEQLKQLNAIQSEIKAHGGNLLIINAEAGDTELAKIAWEHSLSLNFYNDINNEIAEKFRVYSENDPTWNRFSGIDVNIPLLAVYVIDTERQIVYDHVDREILPPLLLQMNWLELFMKQRLPITPAEGPHSFFLDLGLYSLKEAASSLR